MRECNVALYGCGTVGAGVAAILLGRRGALARRLDARPKLRYVVDMRLDHVSGEMNFPETVELTDELERPLQDPDVDVVVELFGGIDAARGVVREALEAGKDVVTANKALLARHGEELYALARKEGQCIAFEASVAGGIPIISSVRNAMVGERIQSVYGIVNGTCNYVLTRMSEQGFAYRRALLEAQEKGYAEADPTLDVEGHDSAHKLAVLARLAFGKDVNEDDIYCEGISNVEPADIQYARSLGYTLKLLAIGIAREEGLELRVHPALLRHDHPLAAVKGAYNTVCVHGDSLGEVILTGPGAGRWPTASAVVGDVCRLALGTYQQEFARLTAFGEVESADVIPLEQIRARYYFRLSCLDRPGVLAGVAGVLGNHGISIASCIQQGEGSEEQQFVPVVFMTHRAKEGALQKALSEINEIDCIDGEKTRMLRVQEI